jgi:hypothetical protein
MATVTELYKVPRVQIAAQVRFVSRTVRDVTMFLGDRAALHPGPERPSDVLNSGDRFIPAIERDAVEFINLESVMAITVEASWEFGDDLEILDAALGEMTRQRLQVWLADGSTLRGDVLYLLPEGQRRVQDYLNGPAPFFALRDAGRVHVVHKRHVVLVVPD